MKPATTIRHIEYQLPQQAVDNVQLQAEHPEWDMTLVAAKTGVFSRRLAVNGELASDLGYLAACKVLENSGTAPQDIDALLFCTQSPDHIMPPNSTLLHSRLGLPKSVAAFDFTLGCSGFIYGAAIAHSFIEALGYGKVLLITADTYSRYLHPGDRSAITLFGDAGAATLFERATSDSAIVDILLGTDGAGGDKFILRAGGLRLPRSDATSQPKRDITGNVRSDDKIWMDGQAVLSLAKSDIPANVNAILCRNNLTIKDLRLILFHQASRFALEQLSSALQIPKEKTFSNLGNLGNTVSASLPILMKDAENTGLVARGDLVLIVGFGVGFSFGSILIRW
jgi:3-oxoacyl-[acyl-carrier-protein] synthase-3